MREGILRRPLALLSAAFALCAAIIGLGASTALADTISVEYGKTTGITATFRYPSTTDITWESSDPSVCTVGRITGNSGMSFNGVYMMYSQTCEVTGTGVGTCTVTAHCGSANAVANVEVTKAKVDVPAASSFTYDGTEHSGVAASSGVTLSGTASATGAGDYAVTASLSDPANSTWADGTTGDKQLSWSIAKAKVDVPAASSFTYDGTKHKAVTKTSGVKFSGKKSAKNAGDYSIIATLRDSVNSEWADGTTDDKVLDWSIAQAEQILDVSSEPQTVKSSKLSKKKLTARAISVSGAMGKVQYQKRSGATAIKVNKKTGAITIAKKTKAGTYKAKIIVTAASTKNYLEATETVTVKVKVK